MLRQQVSQKPPTRPTEVVPGTKRTEDAEAVDASPVEAASTPAAPAKAAPKRRTTRELMNWAIAMVPAMAAKATGKYGPRP